MKPYLWYSKTTSVTGKELGKLLNVPFGKSPPPIDTTHAICWGARVNKATLDNRRYLFNILYLNSIFSLEQVSNKYKALIRMQEHGVSVPKFWELASWFKSIYAYNKESYPFIVRNIRHHGGNGLWLFLKYDKYNMRMENLMEEEWTKGIRKYVIEFINANREYRVHIFRGEIVRITRKFLDENIEEEDLYEEERIVKSHDNGWIHRERNIDKVPECVKEEALKAVSALKLDFGGVDILFTRKKSLWTKKTDSAYVLEVNTGCGLSETGIDIYSNLFKEWLERCGKW